MLDGRWGGETGRARIFVLAVLIAAVVLCCSCRQEEKASTDPPTLAEIQEIISTLSDEELETLNKLSPFPERFWYERAGDTDYTRDSIEEDIRRTVRSRMPLVTHEPGAVRGRAFQFRPIHSFGNTPELQLLGERYVTPVNIDDDPDTEFVMRGSEYSVLELDGSSRPLPGISMEDYFISGSWQYDGEGTEELVAYDMFGLVGHDCEAWSAMDTCILSPEGSLLDRLYGRADYNRGQLADLDGDGSPELLTLRRDELYEPGELMAYGRNGKLLWRSGSRRYDVITPCGDMDGDGDDEVLVMPADGEDRVGDDEVLAVGPGADDIVVPFLRQGIESGPSSCEDLDGDGFDEVLGYESIIDMATGEQHMLEYPAGRHGSGQVWGPAEFTVDAMDYAGQRCFVALVTEGEYERRSDTFVIWDKNGRLLHQQSVGEELLDLFVASYRGQEYLLLQSPTRLLIEQKE